jgi:hypothetical protein
VGAAAVGLAAVGVALLWLGIVNSRPSTLRHFPLDGAATVPATSPVFVVFDEPLDVSARALVFTLRNSSGRRVPSAVNISDGTTSAELRPLRELDPGGYTAAVEVPGVLQRDEWSFTVPPPRRLTDGGGGPILLALSENDPADDFYAEMLRAEGFTSFTTVDASELTAQLLAEHQVLILPHDPGTTDVRLVRDWVKAGGRLITVRPRGALAELAGHRVVERVRQGALLLVDDPAWNAARLRLHGDVDVLKVSPDVTVTATLTPDSGGSPAVTVRDVGRGRVAAFSFDLARSVILTRQGNPSWAGQDRDGKPPARTNDLFFGPAQDDTGQDFVDLEHVEVPHADELMRLLTHLVGVLTSERTPIPRLWYFPNDAEAVLVMAADDHGTPTGTRDFFEQLRSLEPKGCEVRAWECPRATSWMYPESKLSDRDAAHYVDEGFDIGVHVSTSCATWTGDSLDRAFGQDLEAFVHAFPSLPPQHGSRLHCIVWSDYLTQPVVEEAWGIRLDMNYYYWPNSWVRGRAGFMTGSGLPMRFSDPVRGLVDVFQQPTHLVDEVFVGNPRAVEGLLARAQGPQQYVGAFGTHFDFNYPFPAELTGIAVDRNVPMISAQQLLEWVDGRYASRFEHLRWKPGVLDFDVVADPRTHGGLRGMLPVRAEGGALSTLSRNGEVMRITRRTFKGVDCAFFDAATGTYVATYRPGA